MHLCATIHPCKLVKLAPKTTYFSARITKSSVVWHLNADCEQANSLSMCYEYQSKSVVLNLVGGTEPHKFHTCIHRTLRSCKNKKCFLFFKFKTYAYNHIGTVFVHKLYHASFAHKITTFKEQNQQNMNFTKTQKHNH